MTELEIWQAGLMASLCFTIFLLAFIRAYITRRRNFLLKLTGQYKTEEILHRSVAEIEDELCAIMEAKIAELKGHNQLRAAELASAKQDLARMKAELGEHVRLVPETEKH